MAQNSEIYVVVGARTHDIEDIRVFTRDDANAESLPPLPPIPDDKEEVALDLPHTHGALVVIGNILLVVILAYVVVQFLDASMRRSRSPLALVDALLWLLFIAMILMGVVMFLLIRLEHEDVLPKGCECCCSHGPAFVPIGLGLLCVVGSLAFSEYVVSAADDVSDNPAVLVPILLFGVFYLWMGLLSLCWLRGLRKRRQGLCG